MKYRKLPHGNELISELGLGLGGIGELSDEKIIEVITKAIDNGINFFDLCTAKNVFKPLGKAIKEKRESIYIQLHFGAVYNDLGEYGWCRDLETIKNTFYQELKDLNTTYVDFGFLHCVDELDDFNDLLTNGIFDFIKELKEKGIVKHFGFSSHNPRVATKMLDTIDFDIMMFSINPAYDFEQGDEYGIGSSKERFDLFKRCEKEGIAISVMKPFFAGKLLDEKASPFKYALTHEKCIQYALDRPGVITVLPGVQNMEHLDQVLKYLIATKEELDYSCISNFTISSSFNTCVYCNHCQPCPMGIDIGLVNKYYDLALLNDVLAVNHYHKLRVKADSCIDCKHCDNRCPFKVKQSLRMKEINEYFSK